MNDIEVEGSTIDEAIDEALQRLRVTREKVEVDILASPTKGVLGIGGRKARVRVSLRQPLELDAADREPAAAIGSEAGREPGRAMDEVQPGDGTLAARARTLLQDILDHMGFAVRVQASESDEVVLLSITGDSTGVLIGRHGQTLDALEYFLHRVLYRDGVVGRISVDCEQYRVRRRESLEATAARLAQQAKVKNKTMTIEALSPRDRRIIHLALQDEPGLTTRSVGEGYYRKLLVIPEGARPASQGERRDSRPPRTGHRSGNR
jgi:spoIIIJ-associated protein